MTDPTLDAVRRLADITRSLFDLTTYNNDRPALRVHAVRDALQELETLLTAATPATATTGPGKTYMDGVLDALTVAISTQDGMHRGTDHAAGANRVVAAISDLVKKTRSRPNG